MNKLKKIKPYVLPFILAAIHYIITFIYSRNIFDYSNIKSLRLKAVSILIEFAVFITLYFFYDILIKIIRDFKKYKKYFYIFIIYLSIQLIFLVLVWPGIWRWDDLIVVNYAKDYQMVPWQHIVTSIINIISLKLLPFATGVTIIQCILISLIVSYITVNIVEYFKIKKWYIYLIVLFPFLLPSVIDNNLYTLRPILYSYSFLLLFFIMFEIVAKKKCLNFKNGLFITFMFVMVSSWRSEGIYVIIISIVFTLYLILNNKKLKNLLLLLIPIVTIMGTLIITELNKSFTEGNASNNYKVTATVEQIAPLVLEASKYPEYNEILNKIDKVININMIRENESESGIDLYWKGLLRENYSEEEFNDYIKSYYKLCVKFPKTFLYQRYDEFIITSALKKNYSNVLMDTSSAFDNLEEESNYKELIDKFGSIQKPFNTNLRKNVIRVLEGRKLNNYNETNINYLIFYNLILPIMILIISMIYLFIKKKYMFSFITLSILLKTAIVFITAPSPYFMYYFAEYLLGYIYLSIWIVKFINKKNIKNQYKKIKVLKG